MTKDKKRFNSPTQISSHNHEEYDLKSSLNRVNQRKSLKNLETISAFETNQNKSQSIDSTSLTNNQGLTSSLIFQLSESFNSKYDKLKDDISDVGDKISSSNNNLRKELEGKISDKVSNSIFYGAVAVIVTITVIIYSLSYSPLVEKAESNEISTKSILQQNVEIKSKLNSVELKVDKIDNRQDSIDKELIKKK